MVRCAEETRREVLLSREEGADSVKNLSLARA